jgi:hypothetical protein
MDGYKQEVDEHMNKVKKKLNSFSSAESANVTNI